VSDAITVSSRGNIIIPKQVVEQARMKPGQKVMPLVKHGHITIVPLRGLDELIGITAGIDISGFREETDRF
jgi:AbrB family looped-hinge helix DNA binding protein